MHLPTTQGKPFKKKKTDTHRHTHINPKTPTKNHQHEAFCCFNPQISKPTSPPPALAPGQLVIGWERSLRRTATWASWSICWRRSCGWSSDLAKGTKKLSGPICFVWGGCGWFWDCVCIWVCFWGEGFMELFLAVLKRDPGLVVFFWKGRFQVPKKIKSKGTVGYVT